MIAIPHKLREISWSFLDQGLVSGCNFVNILLVVRILDLAEFGVFATLWLVVLFINNFHSAAIVFPMMSLAPQKQDPLAYFGGLHKLQLIFSFGSSGIILLIMIIHQYIDDIPVSWDIPISLSLVVFCYHMQDFYRKYFLTLNKYYLAFICDILTYLFRTAVLTIILLLNLDVSLSLIFYLYAATFGIGLTIGVLNFKTNGSFGAFRSVTNEHWKMAKWLVPSGVLQWASINWYVLAASFMLGPTSVGIIRLVQNIVGAMNVVLLGMENYIPKKLSTILKISGHKAVDKYYINAMILGSTVIVSIGTILSIFSDQLMELLYGPDYVEYGYLIVWYVPIFALMYLAIPIRGMLRTFNATRLWFNAYRITSIFTFIAFYPLIHFFLLDGVMTGIFVSNCVLIFVAFQSVSKITKLQN